MGPFPKPVRSIVGGIADAAARWCNPDFPERVRTLRRVCERTGYSLPVVEYAFDRLFQSLQRDAIERTIVGELGNLDVLDGFVLRADGLHARAMPAGAACVISSRTTIGVALIPAIFALCAKCTVVVKDREDGLASSFFRTLAQEFDGLEGRARARAQAWDGASEEHDLHSFDVVVAFGDDATLGRIRAQLAPTARFVGHGAKASAGYVARDALSDERSARAAARGAARDLVLYESEGCLSLHALFVERGAPIAPEAFAATLQAAIAQACVEFPASLRSPDVDARIAQVRTMALFRASSGRGSVYSDRESSYLAVLDPPAESPPDFLPRTIGVHCVETPQDAESYLRRHDIAIEAIAVAGLRDDVREMAVRAGASRIAAFGEMQAPPLGSYHGGRPRIADFVSWVVQDV